jgi:hypothetical protein
MKKWIPFCLTFVLSLAAAAGFYLWKHSRVEDLKRTARGPAVGRPQAGPVLQATRRSAAMKADRKPEQSKLDAALRPTRNGVRSLFERAGHILEMDRGDVEKLLAELETTGRIRSPLTGITLMAAYARLAELDPAAAMDRAMKGKGEMREMAMFATMNEWLTRDRKGAVAWFSQSKNDDTKRRFLTMASVTMGAGDPELISELSTAINDPDARRKALVDSIGALAFSDPDAAMKKLEEIEDPEDREEAEERVYQGFLMRHPEKALDFAISKPPGDRARENARRALVQWGEQDAGAALTWLTAQTRDIQKELIDSGDKGPGFGFGKATPEQINAAAVQLGDQSQRDKLYAAYANSRGSNDPVAALDQLRSIRDVELQRSTATAIGNSAARSGKTADMERWLQTAPPNETRDFAVAAFAGGLAEKNPAAGLEWAARITSSEIRNRITDNIRAAQAGAEK